MILNKIKNSLQLVGERVVYGTLEEIDTLLPNTEMPAAALLPINNTRLMHVGTQCCEQGQFIVWFVANATPTESTEENDRRLDECMRRLGDWVLSLENSQELKVIGEVEIRRARLEFYNTYTMAGAWITLRENQGLTDCADNVEGEGNE